MRHAHLPKGINASEAAKETSRHVVVSCEYYSTGRKEWE